MVSQPWLEVIWPSASGTRVTWAGFTSSTRSTNFCSWEFPSILNSVVMMSLIAYTSAYRICLSSGRGCTVTPSAPKRCASTAALTTSGLLPPRLLRRVANLLMLTESLVMEQRYKNGTVSTNESRDGGPGVDGCSYFYCLISNVWYS